MVTDLLFKKPWTHSKKAEFMFGVGPAWVHTTKYAMTTNFISGEVVLDLCSGRRRSVDSVGLSNRAASTTLGGGMSNRLE
jgi:hypothetical protein